MNLSAASNILILVNHHFKGGVHAEYEGNLHGTTGESTICQRRAPSLSLSPTLYFHRRLYWQTKKTINLRADTTPGCRAALSALRDIRIQGNV